MCTIAFYWVGENIEIPHRLVTSIRLSMGKSQEVIQLTDQKTPAVPGVTNVQRFDVSPYILVGRLEAYAQVKAISDTVFFCDADSLFVNPIEIDFSNQDLLLAGRNIDGIINHNHPEHYPEFIGKKLSEAMPFITGAIAMKGDRNDLFRSLLEIYETLPERFHRWYGDQYALGLMTNSNDLRYGLLNINKHHLTVQSELSPATLVSMRAKGVQMITFKGVKNKHYMDGTLKNIIKVYMEKNGSRWVTDVLSN